MKAATRHENKGREKYEKVKSVKRKELRARILEEYQTKEDRLQCGVQLRFHRTLYTSIY